MSQKGIVLCGFMGAGKSKIGRLIAGRLGFRFEDLDDEIVKSAGMSITEIFSSHGEAYFRQLEQSLLLQKASENERVLSLGGGTLNSDEKVALIKQHNLLVFINPPFDEIILRVAGGAKRPLVINADGTPKSARELSDELGALFSKRLPFYTQSHLIFEPDPKWDPHQSANTLLNELQAHGLSV